MKRYEYKIIAALVTILISMCCPQTSLGAPLSPQTGRRGSRKVIHHTHTCTSASKSYYFRSQCSDNGFLTVVKNQVLVQTTGLDVHHPDAEFEVETCSSTSRSSSSSSSPIVRYRHKKSKKYICFTKRGKVRTVSKRQVEKRGLLCMFRQQPVESLDHVEANTFHRLQSVKDRRWHLGFDHRNSSLSLIRGRDPHRGALPRRGKSFNPKKCDFKFFAGEHRTTVTTVESWGGLFDLVDKKEDIRYKNKVSKAVELNNVEVSTNELRADFDTVKKSENNPISEAHKEALQQKVLNKKNRKNRNRIRHAKHKQPRLNRQLKNYMRRRKKKPISKS
eukprot:GFUD01026013.1.p1 GENE.GFUD01026013.1~~GFUD01026013.1.p1  ORF type:complete len:333 (-),score=32.78 GFUD01026013.1:608-1606(-)